MPPFPKSASSASFPHGPGFDANLLLETMPWGVLALAPDGTVALLNPAAEALWGVPAAAVLGHAPAQVQPAVLPPELLEALAKPDNAGADATYWLPHTQQWIALRTAPAADGRCWVYWNDVTASKEAAHTAQKHRARQRQTRNLLASVEEVAHTGSYQAELATMSFRFSDGMYRLFGEVPGAVAPSLGFIDARSHPDDVAPVRQVLEQAIAEKRPYRYERRIYRPDGQLRTLEAHGQVVCDKAGNPVKLLGLVQDVTERQQAAAEVLRVQQELARRATDQYRGLFLALDQGYFLAEVEFDEHHQPIDILYLDANPAATRLVGQDFTGRRLKDINPGYEAYWYDIFGRVARTGSSERLEQHAEPDQKWYDFYVFKVGDEASRRVAVVFQDVTGRKQHELALQESEAQKAADLAGMRRLYELQSKLANQNDVEAAFKDVLALACEFTGTDRGCVQFLSSDGKRLEMFVWQGYPDDSPFINFFRYEGLKTGCEVARVQRQRLIIEDTVGFEGLEGTEAGAASYADGIRAAQSTPMASRANETIGVISTQFRQPHRPSDHALRLLDMLAWTAAEFLERHRADAALRESEEKYRSLFNSIDEGFCTVEVLFDEQESPVDYRFLETNPTFNAQTGLANATGRTMLELMPKHERFWFETYGKVALTGEPARFEEYAAALNRWFSVYALRVGEPENRHVAIVFSDISERKRADEALRASEAKYRVLFETMNQGFAVCELLRDEQGRAIDYRYLELNAAWEQHRRQTRAQALASTAGQLEPGLLEQFCQPFERVVATGEPARFEYFAAPLGRWYQYHVFPQGGQRFVKLSDDITDRKQAEEVLRQSAARQAYLLRLSDALSTVADAIDLQGTVAHTTMEYFQADRCYYGELAGNTVTIRRDAARPGLPSVAAVYSLSTMPIFRTMLQGKRPVVVADVHTSAAMDDNLKQLCLGFGIVSYINVPIIKNGEQVGMLCLTQGTPREWTALEIGLVQETAERTWAAVERARAEEALLASEQRQRMAIEAADMGTWTWDLPTNEIHWNDQHFALFGQEPRPAPVSPEDFARQLHPDDREWVWQRLLAAVAQQHVFEAEFRIVRADDGQTRWMSGYGQTVEAGSAGDTRRMSGVVFDITARKQAEQQLQELMAALETQVMERTEALRRSQELLQLVFDTSPMALSVQQAVRDANGEIQDFRVLLLNKELERELGRTDMVGKHYAQEYPGMKPSGLFGLMRAAVETGEPQHLEYYYPFEGFNRWFACTFVKLNDGVVATNVDITPRKLAEEKNREQAHFIARVNETLPDLMTVTELASGQVLYVNRDLDEAPGFEREKLLNIPLQEQAALLRLHPDDATQLPEYFARAAALADHEIATYDYRAKLNADRWRWFQVRGSVFQRDPATGAATQVLSVSQDVTARREAELAQAKSYQLLEQSEEVASLGSWDYNRATGEFLWSAGMYRLFGLPPGSPVRPATYLDFVVTEDRPVAERIVQRLTTARTGFEETLRIQVADAVKTVRVKAAPALDAAGEPLRMLGVDLDISEVQRLEAENLHLRLTQQQALFGAVLEAQETERGRMAESLHNGLGQILYAAKLQLNQLLAGPAPTALARADQLLANAIRQTRTLSHELVPTVLNEFGLAAALLDVCRGLRSPQLRFECTVELDEAQPLPQPLQLAVYRMAQELAQNVVKHAHATQASLALETVPGFVLLRAEDNGVGFVPMPPAGSGIGLRTIRNRVALLGGTVDLGSSPNFGTYVRIRFPLPAPAPPAA